MTQPLRPTLSNAGRPATYEVEALNERGEMQPTSVAANGSQIERLAYRFMGPLFQSAAQGALPQLYAATAPEAEPGGHYGPSELGGLNGWPKPVPMAKAALDPVQGARLWQVSEELTRQV